MNVKELIDYTKTAEILGISKASIRNWVKHGYLQHVDSESKYFNRLQVQNLKDSIDSGNIDRLQKRANKGSSNKNFIPSEYIRQPESRQKINELISFIKRNRLSMKLGLLGVAINLFKANGDILFSEFNEILQFPHDSFRRENVRAELRDFYQDILNDCENSDIQTEQVKVLHEISCFTVPVEEDLLGIVYQSLLNEGKKSSLGSYFTPGDIVDEMVLENLQNEKKVLDPCCGTGQFLLRFADTISNPENVWGIDVDLTAVRIARFNLLLKYPMDFKPHIYYLNTLRDINFVGQQTDSLFPVYDSDPDVVQNPFNLQSFDFVATNPPWGAEIDKSTLKKVSTTFPEITSGESFSYFLISSLKLLREGGTLSFVLPEAILNVRTHSDIRKYILENCRIQRIHCLGKKFKNVLSSVIRIDLIKEKPSKDNLIEIKTLEASYLALQQRFSTNKWFVFDVYISSKDEEIIRKIYHTQHVTLENNADWALGIVTGDNRKFLSSQPESQYEPIFTGSDVERFVLKQPTHYVLFKPENFQQVAPVEKYRAKEKLIYRFISSQLVFAYDNQGSLTLNSANIVIPRFEDYPVKVILALLNCSLYQFLYMKKFNSIKILRGDLEQLPFPLWEKAVFGSIVRLVDSILEGKSGFDELDTLIMKQFGLTPDESKYIQSFAIRRNTNGKTKKTTARAPGENSAG